MAPRGTQGIGESAAAYRYTGLGLQFAATICLFGFGGYWLDGKLGTLPLLLIIGVFLGFALGTISLVKRLPPSTKRPASTRDPSSSSTDDERGPTATP